MIKMLFYVPFLLLSTSFSAINPKRIDATLKKTEMLLNEGKSKEYLAINEQLAKDAATIKYSKGIAIANFRIAMALNRFGDFKKSIDFLNIAEDEPYTISDPSFRAALMRIQGENYSKLKLFESSTERHKMILRLAVSDKALIHGMANNNIGHNFLNLRAIDSAYAYFQHANTLLQHTKGIKETILASIVNCNLGEYWLQKKERDSVTFYLFKALRLAELSKSPYALQQSNKVLGGYFLSIQKADLAVKYLNTSLNYAKQSGDLYALKDMYRKIYEAYRLKNDDRNSLAYLKLHTSISDSIDKIEKKNINAVILSNTLQTKKQYVAKETGYKFIITVISVSLLLLAWLGYKNFISFKHERKKRKLDHSNFINSLSAINEKFEAEAPHRLIKIARAKDPGFLTQFNEFYPNFSKSLLVLAPSLHANELLILSYAKLNFDTKEIARVADMTVKSVESRKYRIRKKIGIKSEDDFNIWVLNFKH